MQRPLPSFKRSDIVVQLMQQPNWVTDADPETRKGCGPCQVGTIEFERPPHFWSGVPSLVDLEYAQRSRMGALGGNANQTNWCEANDQLCGSRGTGGGNAGYACGLSSGTGNGRFTTPTS